MTNEALVARIQNGDREKMEELWGQTECFIKKQANKWTTFAEHEDLVQQAFFILVESVESYDSQRGFKFITWLGKRLSWGWQRWISDSMLGFHLPAHMAIRLLQYDRACKEWAAKTGRQPTERQLCYLMECSRSELQTVKNTMRRIKIRSLQELTKSEDGDGVELGELLSDGKDFTEDVLDDVQREQLKAILWPLVDELEGRQGEVLKARYEKCQTLDDISESLNISRERVRQIEAKALQKLRRPKNKKKLQPFYEITYSRALQGTGLTTYLHTWESSVEREALRQCGTLKRINSE